MDRQKAVQVLIELVAEQDDGGQARQALATLLSGAPPFPPSPYGRVGGTLAEAAQHIHKTGSEWEWRTPAPDSVGMERLVQRLTTVLEAFMDMWEAERQRVGEMRLWDAVQEETQHLRQERASKVGLETLTATGLSESRDFLGRPWPLEDEDAQAHVDEAYQADFCDECGSELAPDGVCPIERWGGHGMIGDEELSA